MPTYFKEPFVLVADSGEAEHQLDHPRSSSGLVDPRAPPPATKTGDNSLLVGRTPGRRREEVEVEVG